MSPVPAKPTVWILEEATPQVAELMHQLERALGKEALAQRLSYAEALRRLPGERGEVRAVVAFSLQAVRNLAGLLKHLPRPRPQLCFLPPAPESLAELKPDMRWPVPISVVARHAGEAALFAASGFSHVVKLGAALDLSRLPEGEREKETPLRVGVAWHNLAPAQRPRLLDELKRWAQSAPDRCRWHVLCFPGEDLGDWAASPEIQRAVVTPDDMATDTDGSLGTIDVLLADPWWPDAHPRPWRAPVTLFLPPGGGGDDAWRERLQGLLDLLGSGSWERAGLLGYCYQPLWRHLLKGEERPFPALEAADVSHLADERERWQAWLHVARSAWGEASPRDLAFFFWVYDYRVQVSWCHDLWRALASARNGDRHAILMALNALGLHHTGRAWLLKRLLAKTAPGRLAERRLTRRFWWSFAWRRRGLLLAWVKTVKALGKGGPIDPMPACRDLAAAVLEDAGVTVSFKNRPAPVPGVPVIYLMSHRNADLDAFLLLHVLPDPLAVVVGPRAQRLPLVGRLGLAPGFVLTGAERGVVIADAIAALRSRRALAMYPEVTEPTYLGEGSPLRSGLLWIVQALERCQIVPVILDDAFALGGASGEIAVRFGEPIACESGTDQALLHRVRAFFHLHAARVHQLDASAWVETSVPGPEAARV